MDASAMPVSPELPLSAGGGYVDGIPSAFRDSSPDRWGRRLVDKRNREASDGVPRQLDEVDYLLGVSDAVREGALRFRPVGGDWLGGDVDIPPVVQLPELLDASRSVLSDVESHEELKMLLDAGSSSLGGARPKASVLDGDKLLLAKFSREADAHDVIGVEKATIDAMVKCGIEAPCASLVRFGSQAALLLERFDREGSEAGGTRVPYISAMSLLGMRDGEQATYFDLLEHAVELCGYNVVGQMLLRIAFSIAVNNTDDHLRNHGFLFRDGAWSVSPCFDVNPNPQLRQRQTPVLGGGGDEVAELVELAHAFDVADAKLRSMFDAVVGALAGFEMMARKNGVSAHTLSLVMPVINRGCEMLQVAK